MKKITLGIFAHVDAGKTTLTECMLYNAGSIRKMGRVDNRDAFLDTDIIEKERGITIFSKQAEYIVNENIYTIIDTPGHFDFSGEMERSLSIVDYAIIVLSASEGIKAHTETLISLFKEYNIPYFVFVNKMDMGDFDKEDIINELNEKLKDEYIDFTELNKNAYENIAALEESTLEFYLENEYLSDDMIKNQIKKCILHPCYFGSALNNEGVTELMNGIDRFTINNNKIDEFGARVFKISRDSDGNRLTHIKVTGGSLKVRQIVNGEKINQIRRYQGAKYQVMDEAVQADIVCILGMENSFSGQGFGFENDIEENYIKPLLSYKIILEDSVNINSFLPKLKQLEEEEPLLHIKWNQILKELQVESMGEIQLQTLKRIVKDRYGVDISFDDGNILYLETIKEPCYGVGHFEPLKHYAEVHLLFEPLERGKGIVIENRADVNVLDKNWQRLIITHLKEKQFTGVLTNSPITDMKISVITGRAHKKHTEGGDFREAVYRAVRQGLMNAKSVLLEPYYDFKIDTPTEYIGKIMNDIDKLNGKYDGIETFGDRSILKGIAPVATIKNYQKDIMAYTKGQGRISFSFCGYKECHNEEEVINQISYDPNSDIYNLSCSVFFKNGEQNIVPWNKVFDNMHLLSQFENALGISVNNESDIKIKKSSFSDDVVLGLDEIDSIINSLNGTNSSKDKNYKKRKYKETLDIVSSVSRANKNNKNNLNLEKYLLVDGYNILHAWDDFKELLNDNLDGARGKLLDIMCNYQAVTDYNLIVVFDAYKVKNHEQTYYDYNNIHVVYTKEAETADSYIEKFAHQNKDKYNITVATSDGLEQLIIRGAGATLISAKEFKEEVKNKENLIMTILQDNLDKITT